MRELRYYAGRHKICGKICDRIIAFFQGVCLTTVTMIKFCTKSLTNSTELFTTRDTNIG